MKTRTSQEILDNAYNMGVISEKDILLLKRRLNNGEKIRIINELKVSKEQKEKGLKWLRNLYISPTGKERKNNPFCWREIDILICPDEKLDAYLIGYCNIGSVYRKQWVPIYEYTNGEKSFSYYLNEKEIRIIP